MSEETGTRIAVEEMKNRLCYVFHRHMRGAMATYEKQRKLVLHFDVNKTIVPVDSSTGETVEDALNVYLSGMAWGRDRDGDWEGSPGDLSHSPRDHDTVSFYKFEEKRLLRNSTQDRSALRGHLISFTDKPQGSTFKPYLNMLLNQLKWNLPYDEKHHKELTVPGTKQHRYHFILPSFYKLLNFLVRESRDFSVIFRTYGSDAKSVIESIRCAIKEGMPYCAYLSHLADTVSTDVQTLSRTENGQFQLTSSCSNDATECMSDCEMYALLNNTSGVVAIRDDVQLWYRHHFQPEKGKPFWLDFADNATQHIFFDDNIRPGRDDSIVNIRCRDTASGFRDLTRAEEYKLVNTNIVPVVFPDAIMDEDYFVKKLQLCEENYSLLVSSSKR